MAYFKAYPGMVPPEPSDWDMELYNVDFSSSDPYDEIRIGGNGMTVEFSLDTDADLYDNNNSFGFVTLENAGHEPENCVRVVQFAINKHKMYVYIRGRICFMPPSASDEQHQAIGEITGARREFDGDYRGKALRATFNDQGFFRLEIKDEDTGLFHELCATLPVGVPDGWEEGHEGEWEYINHYYPSYSFNHFVFGSWYGGVGHHQFDGKANYIKIKSS